MKWYSPEKSAWTTEIIQIYMYMYSILKISYSTNNVRIFWLVSKGTEKSPTPRESNLQVHTRFEGKDQAIT